MTKAAIDQTESNFKEKAGFQLCWRLNKNVQKWKEEKAKSEKKGEKGRDKSLSIPVNDSKRKEGGNKIGASTAILPSFRD